MKEASNFLRSTTMTTNKRLGHLYILMAIQGHKLDTVLKWYPLEGFGNFEGHTPFNFRSVWPRITKLNL